MRMRRRDIVAAFAAAGFVTKSQLAFGQVPTSDEFDGMESLEPLPSDYNAGLGSPNFRLSPQFGSAPPPDLYKAVARVLLTGAPVSCRPIDVAYYFDKIRQGILKDSVAASVSTVLRDAGRLDLIANQFARLFAYDWERNNYFNPVVVQFILGIRSKAYAGDVTPWCAAFANWCIARSRATNPALVDYSGAMLAHGTRVNSVGSASSGTFRCWGNATSDPKEGDIVVWAMQGTENASCPIVQAQGHVGFYVRTETRPDGSKAYRVLGGNQGFVQSTINVNGSAVVSRDLAQAVSMRGIGLKFSDRVFHSIRTKPFLRA